MIGSFFFVTSEVEFQEATEKGARVLATFMELDTPSSNNRIYRIEEAKTIAKSLIGKPIRYGYNWLGKHLKEVPVIGIVEQAWQEAKKIKGIVRIWEKGVVDTLKAGAKYLFSVGGVAEFSEVIQKGKQLFQRLHNALCTHLQLLPNDPDRAGFPTAKMHEIIEINESVMKVQCDSGCGECGNRCILRQIKSDFEEATRMNEAVEKAINKAVGKDIAEMIWAVIREPWKFVENES
jgi:hypothetical protein